MTDAAKSPGQIAFEKYDFLLNETEVGWDALKPVEKRDWEDVADSVRFELTAIIAAKDQRIAELEKQVAFEDELGLPWFVVDRKTGTRLRGPYKRPEIADAVRHEVELSASEEKNEKWDLYVSAPAPG